jgi:sporulation protein YlmC with PRC-barrel domain
MRAHLSGSIFAAAILALAGGGGSAWAAANDPVVPQRATNGSAADIDRANLEALLDKKVIDSSETEVGKVQDVVMDPRGSQAKMLVVRLKDQNKSVAVPFAQAGYQAAQGQVRLIGMGEEELAALADFRLDDSMVSLKKPAKDK